jgi:transcriptional regulator with XRE-family HTH domain
MPDLISSRLRELRLKRGLTLAQVAARAGTSSATLSKYENGWERFELYTLSKIATALGCRLKIDFEFGGQTRSPGSVSSCKKKIQRLFWDHKLKDGDFKRYPQWIVERVVEYGSLEDIHSVIRVMGKRFFLRQVSSCRFRSPKALNFWRSVLEREGVKCTKRSFQREARNS